MHKYLLIFFIIIGLKGLSQDIEKIGKKDGIVLSGGVGANASAFATNNENSLREPYSYNISGNLSLAVYDVLTVPFTFAYSNERFNYSGQRINIVGLSPKYRNLTVHMGYRNMSFSSLTLAGHSFWGGGAEYSWAEKNLRIAAMGGELLRAVEYNPEEPNQIPAYSRFGEGAMIEYSKNGNQLKAIVFYAKDNKNSIAYVPELVGLKPEENMVYSIFIKRKVSEIISFEAEGAVSAWTKDINDDEVDKSKELQKNIFLIDNRMSTQYYDAFKSKLDFAFKAFSCGLEYQRVEPGYHTLGAYNVTNDFENVRVNGSTSLLKKKLSLSVSAGTQRDDLEGDKVSSMRRFVGSASASYKASKRLNLNASYNGFNSMMKVKPIDDSYVKNTVYDQLDTMNYIQLTQSLAASMAYKLRETDDAVQNLNVSTNFQKADNEQGNRRFGNSMANGMTGYSISFKQTGLSLSANLNCNVSSYDEGESVFAGLGMNASKTLFQKKVSASLGGNASNNYQNGTQTALLYAVNNNYSYKFGKGHSLRLGLRYSGRAKMAEAEFGQYNKSLNEFLATIGYRYSFSKSF